MNLVLVVGNCIRQKSEQDETSERHYRTAFAPDYSNGTRDKCSQNWRRECCAFLRVVIGRRRWRLFFVAQTIRPSWLSHGTIRLSDRSRRSYVSAILFRV